jgi:hypothetical protein
VYRDRLLPDHARVGYLLSPNPVIIANALANKDPEDLHAAKRLIDKLLLPADIVDKDKRLEASAELYDSFLTELSEFQNKRGHFAKQKMWVIAAKPEYNAAQWHKKYTVSFTQVLGKLAARVCSKSVGIGEAERVWKSVKKQSKGQRGKLSQDKQQKQDSIAAAYCHEKGASRHALAQRAGVLWDDADFETCKFCEYCEGDIVRLPKKPLCILRAWNETAMMCLQQHSRRSMASLTAQIHVYFGDVTFLCTDATIDIGHMLPGVSYTQLDSAHTSALLSAQQTTHKRSTLVSATKLNINITHLCTTSWSTI